MHVNAYLIFSHLFSDVDRVKRNNEQEIRETGECDDSELLPQEVQRQGDGDGRGPQIVREQAHVLKVRRVVT